MKPWLTVVGAFALVVVSGVQARAQMGVARGLVVDQDGAPVKDAKVHLLFLGEVEREYTTKTDDKGQYTQVVGTGRYRVTVSKDGYQGRYMDEAVRTGSPTDLPTIEIVSREAVVQAAMAPILKRFDEAAALLKAGKLDEAAVVFLELKEKHPDIPEVYLNLGTIYTRQEKWQAAEEAYQKVLELSPGNARAQTLLADARWNLGRTEEALTAMENLVAENPDDSSLRYTLGVYYVKERRYQEAAAAFEEVRKSDPDNVDVFYMMGVVSLNQGQAEQAVSRLRSYLEKAPEDGPYRATVSELLSQLEKALPPPQ